ncbi:MarR family winged helix-turn-helix transcriptional regulator [Ligilactobacillus saerimneri]|uniref:MarR family transcriptional regulator n=1 Tax=Ligilactobacillus saerimneri 30a TaxID=1227363 RepID=M5J883_9LACO|nr:MarR family winged helix-turn-helix transcriptional regulator [Ligilactobacillus saerimneri]EKW99814.1 MarR family transcriptional regulator [Ligilactobacillus saerimneri 30a]MBU5310019.1 MarR family winged helix-turn-helix transcriptional regulator [Ligilactobacillus saerimneri]MCZ0890892.1 MarR family winged helix-turn-helix transcriptional regulator [Ligilactobacillus saerimneri]MDY4003530.1 MarR family winged helix-turn-helix transcriptional regulator [Ligilactobacillus saerimneri]HJF29
MNSLQKSMTNLAQVLRLHEQKSGSSDELAKLGVIDVYYLEAIYQLKDPTIGTISKLLGQSTPNTNYHIKKLEKSGLIEKRLDDVDRRVTHLYVTEKYLQMLEFDAAFWADLQQKLEESVTPSDLAIFRRVLRETTDIITESTLHRD